MMFEQFAERWALERKYSPITAETLKAAGRAMDKALEEHLNEGNTK